MIVTVINPLDNTEVEVEINLNVRLVVQADKKILSVSGAGSKVLDQQQVD